MEIEPEPERAQQLPPPPPLVQAEGRLHTCPTEGLTSTTVRPGRPHFQGTLPMSFLMLDSLHPFARVSHADTAYFRFA